MLDLKIPGEEYRLFLKHTLAWIFSLFICYNLIMKIIGIAGGTGSGKTTLAFNLDNALGGEQTRIISYDSYYRDQSKMTMGEREATNYDHPDSLETDLLIEHLHQLKSGQTVHIPTYDFTLNTRSKNTTRCEPSDYLILEGILLLVDQRLRDLIDVKVFIDVEPDIRLVRRIQRDIIGRNRTLESVLESWQTKANPMHKQFVEPTKEFADVIVKNGGESEEGLSSVVELVVDS